MGLGPVSTWVRQDMRTDAREQFLHRWRMEGWHGKGTIDAALSSSAARRPDSKLVYHGERGKAELTLGQMCTQGEAVASGLFALGFRAGDAIVVQLPHCPEVAILWYAAMRLGLVMVPVIHIYGPTELDFIIADSNARGFVIADSFHKIDWSERARCAERAPDLKHLIPVGEGSTFGGISWGE